MKPKKGLSFPCLLRSINGDSKIRVIASLVVCITGSILAITISMELKKTNYKRILIRIVCRFIEYTMILEVYYFYLTSNTALLLVFHYFFSIP